MSRKNNTSVTLSFIMLVWNSERFLDACIQSIFSKCLSESIGCEIIVIDNGSVDGSAGICEGYQQRYPDNFFLLALDRNRGTTYPRNLGLSRARGEFACIMDSDTELGAGDLKAALELLRRRPDVGIVAPRLQLPDGITQNSVKRFPTMLHKLIKVPRILLGLNTANRDFYEDFPFDHERDVDTAISACWLFRRDMVATVGYLDEKIFYAPEDLDYSIRVRKAGYKILYYPKLEVLHHTQQITHRKPLSRVSVSHFNGLLYYYAKHGGWVFPPEV